MKYRLLMIFIVIMFLINNMPVFAYEIVDKDNEFSIYSDIKEIYNLRDMYYDLAGKKDDDEEIVYEEVVTSDSYWWPIGSKETTSSGENEFATGDSETVTITSTFGATGDVSSHAKGHGGLDIGGGRKGETNIIAAKDGVVVYPVDNSKMSCPDGNLGNTCGGGYGNYVILQHSDGNFTLYGHMYANSITVKAGDTVKQGQVIGKMGTSGDSSGPHLHFEVRVGANDPSKKVDPLEYISADNPRPSIVNGDVLSMALEVINHYEGVGCEGELSEEGDNYVACGLCSTNSDGEAECDGVITIGRGVAVDYDNTWEVMDRFKKYGYDKIEIGTRVPKSVVDKIQVEEIENNYYNELKNCLSKAGIDDLKNYQLAALVTRAYNTGLGRVCPIVEGMDNFVDSYLKFNGEYKLEDMYSSSPSIWTDSMNYPINPPVFRVGLQRRRVGEWIWFNTGEMDYMCDGGCFDPDKYSW